MTDKLRGLRIAIAAVVALAAGGVAIAGAMGGERDDGEGAQADRPITGEALARARAAAREAVGGGRVTATEAGDEETAYEVEVTRPDGRRVDVQLDRGFAVVGTEEEPAGDR